MPKSDTYFTKENAREMQRRGVKKRVENKITWTAIAKLVKEEALKPVNETGLTKMQWLVMRMFINLKDDVKPKDIKDLQEIVGEFTQKIEAKVDKSSEQILKDVFGDEG